MRIGIVIGRIGGVDGVALETEKWATVLRRLGHEVFILTGELEAEVPGSTVLPALAFSHPATLREQDDAFFVQDAEERELVDRLHRDADRIGHEVLAWLTSERIDVLITQNSTTLPCHLTMGMALKRVIELSGIPTIAHDHDFHWERGDRYTTRYAGVRDIVEQCFPPDLPNLTHVVINSYCRDSLRERHGIEAHVVPNVMDFDAGFGQPDDFNRRIPDELGFAPNDIVLFQMTRVVRRKGIETAIELVERLDDPRVKLVVTGHATDDYNGEYLGELHRRAARLPRPEQVRFAADRFANVRVAENGAPGKFSLSDGYASAHACTYFSRYEGFGNAFVEALAARVPIFVNNYEPVYWPDIGSKGFKTVQIENNELTDRAVEDARAVLTDADHRADIAEFNHEIGRRHFSYEVLGRRLDQLLAA
jgi:glycosyltransferase involved in cell wall biosynthesis